MSESTQHIFARLKRARQQQDLTQRELARRAGISRSYLARLERGDYPQASLQLVDEWCAALGLELTLVLRS